MRKPMDSVEAAMTTALKIANTFRREIGEKEVDGMVAGLSSDATECILARTFNANCYVAYDNAAGMMPDPSDEREYEDEFVDIPEQFYGYAAFGDEQTAHAFARAVNEHDREAGAEATKSATNLPDHPWRVDLPTPVAQIAFDFDQHQLAEDFYAGDGDPHTVKLGVIGA